jgi:biotin carboxyl carrier protein
MNIYAKKAKVCRLASPISGPVSRIKVAVGDKVKKNQVLFRVGKTGIKSPCAGVVIRISTENGDWITPSAETFPLMEIATG